MMYKMMYNQTEATVIRKQLYLEPRHDALLKHLAQTRGISEAEVVRQALETSSPPARRGVIDPAAWERAVAFMRSLDGSTRPPRRQWQRANAYRTRLDRYARRPR